MDYKRYHIILHLISVATLEVGFSNSLPVDKSEVGSFVDLVKQYGKYSQVKTEEILFVLDNPIRNFLEENDIKVN